MSNWSSTAESRHEYIHKRLIVLHVLVRKGGDQIDVTLNLLSLPRHLAVVVAALTLLNSFEHLLVLLHNLHQLSFAVGFVQSFLGLGCGRTGPFQELIKVAYMITTSHTFHGNIADLVEQHPILPHDFSITELLQHFLLWPALEKLELGWPAPIYTTLQVLQLTLMDLPRTLQLLVEAKLVGHGDLSKHLPYGIEIISILHLTLQRRHIIM